MVSHHEVAVLGNHHLRHGPAVAELLRHVVLHLRLAVEPDLTVVNAQPVSRQRDHPLDVAFLRVAWIVKNHYVAALDSRDVIDKLVDE